MTAVASRFTWEENLTRHFLRADGPGGSSPLAFIDASPEELARATGRLRSEGEVVLDEFLSIFSRAYLDDVLQHGVVPRQARDLEGPGWFHILILTCVVASMSPEMSQSGQFRKRLQELLRLPSPLSNFPNLPVLWHKLSRWCDSRRKVGLPYRKVVVPDPGRHMTQIGHSVRIVFPSRQDLHRMVKQYSHFVGETIDPDKLIRQVRSDYNLPWSAGFRAAFQDFEKRRQNRERLIADHPFLKGIRNLMIEEEVAASETSVSCITDIDGFDVLEVTTNNPLIQRHLGYDPNRDRADGIVEIEVTDDTLVSMLQIGERLGPDINLGPLGRSIQEGVLPFCEEGWGKWCACRDPATASARLLIRPDLAKRYLGLTEAQWAITGPLKLGMVVELLDRVRGRRSAPDAIGSYKVRGGIKFGSSYLGRPCFLPVLEVDADCDVDLEEIRHEKGTLSVDTSMSRVYPLQAPSPVAGAWRLSIEERAGLPSHAEVLLGFVDRAPEHEFVDPNELPPVWQAQRDIERSAPRAVTIDPSRHDLRGTPVPAMLDLLEVLYTKGGGMGLAEETVGDLVSRAVGFNGPVIWDLIRLLQEAGWIEPRLSARWNARRWFVRKPRLLLSDCGTIGLVDGAASEVVCERLANACQRRGGRFVIRSHPTGWSVPSYLIENVDPKIVASDAEIPIEPAVIALQRATEHITFVPSLHSAERREVGSTWDWRTARFKRQAFSSEGQVTLERLVKPGNNARPVYRTINGSGAVTLIECRAAAILNAHMAASRPMFRFDPSGDRVQRIAGEGHIPIEIARYLRLSTAASALVIPADEWNAEYLYPISTEARADLVVWLGPALEGGQPYAGAVKEINPLKTLVLNRRGGRSVAAAAKFWK